MLRSVSLLIIEDLTLVCILECRNNIHPTYMPRAADVWSLGIVLINMCVFYSLCGLQHYLIRFCRLYHCNPWSDTTQGVCPAFELYLSQPIQFFMNRFNGMTYPVAEFLTTRVFCLLEDPHDDSSRITAAEFGRWVKDLPAMLGMSERPGHARNLSISSTMGYTLASVPASRRPSLRQQHTAETRASWVVPSGSHLPSVRTSWALSRNPSFSLGPVSDMLPESFAEGSTLPPVIDQEVEVEADVQADAEAEVDATNEQELDSRTGSTQKRRKRGARKGKGAASSSSLVPPSSPTPTVDDATLNTLAEASQALAREISRTNKGVSLQQVLGLSRPDSVDAPGQHPPVLLSPSSSAQQPSPHSLSYVSSPISPVSPVPTVIPVAVPAPITKKPSKWKLGFGRGSHTSQAERSAKAVPPPVPPLPPLVHEATSGPTSLVSLQSTSSSGSQKQSAVAHNVTNLIMGLNAPSAQPAKAQPTAEEQAAWARGRRPRPAGAPMYAGSNGSSTWGPSSSVSAFGATGPYAHQHSNGSNASWNTTGTGAPLSSTSQHISNNPAAASSSAAAYAQSQSQPQQPQQQNPQPRNVSPASTRSGKPLASSASSMASSTNNWRSSMSSTGTANSSTSAFTRYSNGSSRSVSTAATSVSSASSWRSGASKYPYNDTPGQLPPNVKREFFFQLLFFDGG